MQATMRKPFHLPALSNKSLEYLSLLKCCSSFVTQYRFCIIHRTLLFQLPMSRTYEIESRLVDIIESLHTTTSLCTYLVSAPQLFPLVAVPCGAVTAINDITTLHRSLHYVLYLGQRHAPSITQAISAVYQVNDADMRFDAFDKLVSGIASRLSTAPHDVFENIHHIMKYYIRNISIRHNIDILGDLDRPKTIDTHRSLIKALDDLTEANLLLCQYLKSNLGLLARTQHTSVGILYNSIKLQDILFQYLLHLDPSKTQGQSPVNAAPTRYPQSPAANQSANDFQVCATSLEHGVY
jgi:hypothetical protein